MRLKHLSVAELGARIGPAVGKEQPHPEVIRRRYESAISLFGSASRRVSAFGPIAVLGKRVLLFPGSDGVWFGRAGMGSKPWDVTQGGKPKKSYSTKEYPG